MPKWPDFADIEASVRRGSVLEVCNSVTAGYAKYQACHAGLTCRCAVGSVSVVSSFSASQSLIYKADRKLQRVECCREHTPT